MNNWIVRIRPRGYLDNNGFVTRTKSWARQYRQGDARDLAKYITGRGEKFAWAEPRNKVENAHG